MSFWEIDNIHSHPRYATNSDQKDIAKSIRVPSIGVQDSLFFSIPPNQVRGSFPLLSTNLTAYVEARFNTIIEWVEGNQSIAADMRLIRIGRLGLLKFMVAFGFNNNTGGASVMTFQRAPSGNLFPEFFRGTTVTTTLGFCHLTNVTTPCARGVIWNIDANGEFTGQVQDTVANGGTIRMGEGSFVFFFE